MASNPKSKQQILQAIKELGYRVAVADVAAKTGLPLHVANLQLNHVALETRGILEVAQTGNIVYSFSRDFENAYAEHELKQAALRVVRLVIGVLFYIVRISFGLLLLASFLTLIVLFSIVLVVILMGGEAGDGDADCGDGLGLDWDFYDIVNLSTFFVWSHREIGTAGEPIYLGRQVDTGDKGFLINCFYFLFGDGDPNRHYEEQKWKHVANLIRLNNGVVTSDQLAPYTGANPADESQVLPVLVRFEGFPEVTETGSLVYVFPSLQVTAAIDRLVDLPPYAEEKQWAFTQVPLHRLQMVFFFAGANLAGWFCLWKNLWRLDFLMPYKGLIELMLIYALFFLGLPILRQLVNAVKNGIIEARNAKRMSYVKSLAEGKAQHKIAEARAFALQMLRLRSEHMVYTTERDILEQQF